MRRLFHLYMQNNQKKDEMIQIVEQTWKTDMADAFRMFAPEKKCRFRKYFNKLGISLLTLRDSQKEEQFENPVFYNHETKCK